MVATFAPLVLEHFPVWSVNCTCVMSVKGVLELAIDNDSFSTQITSTAQQHNYNMWHSHALSP